jgi:DNA transposition AAA+ family ATPase
MNTSLAIEAGIGDNFVKWTDRELDVIAQGYPQEMREPLMWLGWFGREECGRDLDILVSRAKELGIQHDKTSWSKILRGKWNKDKEGQPLISPVIALQKFLKAVQLLRDDHRVREMAGKVPFIMTPTAKDIFDYIDVRRAPERVNRFGVVVGYTGTQKTATFKEYCRRHNHGMCVWLEAPETGSMAEFMCWLGTKYGGAHTDSMNRARIRVFSTVKSRHTIIVDNAQSMYRAEKEYNQPTFSFLRRLQDEKQCTVILSITPEFHDKLMTQMLIGYFEQFEGRAGGRRNFLVLPKFPPAEDVLEIAKAFGLKDAEKHLEYLTAIAGEAGRVRRLFEDLQEAKICAEREKRPFSIGHVKEVRDED